jgi:hypothetical protein
MHAGATDLNSGFRTEGYWSDNVYSSTFDEVDDFSGRVSPWAEVADDDGDVTWGLRYGPSYEYYISESDLRGVDHEASARLGWRLSPQTSVELFDRFQRYHSVSRFNDQADPGSDVLVEGRRVEYMQNVVGGGLTHTLTPRDVLALNVAYTTQDFDEEGQFDREYYGTNLVYRHRLSERTVIGGMASWSRQTSERDEVADLSTDYTNLSALLTYAVSRTMTLEVSAGPAWITSDANDFDPPPTVRTQAFPLRQQKDDVFLLDADTCPIGSGGGRIVTGKCDELSPPLTDAERNALQPVNSAIFPFVGTVPSADDSSFTYFADVSLVKNWERVTGEVAYQRREDQSSGFGAVSDVYYGSLRWQITRRLSAKVLGSYERREQATEGITFVQQVSNQPIFGYPGAARTNGVVAELIESNSGIDVILANLQVAYQLSPRSEVYTNFLWRDEQSDSDSPFVRDMQRLQIVIGFNIFFDPIDL